jgi:hypothetical protein
MLRSRTLLLLALVAPVALVACAASLDLGTNDVGPAAGPPDDAGTPAEAAPPAPTLEERLRARCNEAHGQRDPYRSAAELLSKLTGRWYLCTAPAVSPLGQDGIELLPDAGWHRLVWPDAPHDSLVAADTPQERGGLRCVAFADPDAGAGLDGGPGADAGTSTAEVPCDDPTPRQGIFVYLEPESGPTHVLSIELEQSPKRQLASEVGPSSETAELVPAD